MKQEEKQDERKRTAGVEEKKIYSAPRLISYGDFRSLTLGGKLGMAADNVFPFAKSKAAGGG